MSLVLRTARIVDACTAKAPKTLVICQTHHPQQVPYHQPPISLATCARASNPGLSPSPSTSLRLLRLGSRPPFDVVVGRTSCIASGSLVICPGENESSNLLLSPSNSIAGASAIDATDEWEPVLLGTGRRWRDEADGGLPLEVAGVVGGGFSMRAVEDLCVRSCCFMLSLRVKALWQVGQCMFFSPVCFLPWRAAWPEVVKVSGQE